MKNRCVFSLALVALGLVTGYGQSTVDYAAGLGQRSVSFEGLAVPDGNEVRIGFFSSGFDITAYVYDLGALDSAWNEYGSTSIRTLLGQEGRFAASQSYSSSTAINLFDNRQIYLWILQTTDNTAPAGDYGNVTRYGLYTSSDPTWIFPAYYTSPPFNATAINSDQVNQAYFGSFDQNYLYLAAVPEPSLPALLIIGFGLFALRAKLRTKD